VGEGGSETELELAEADPAGAESAVPAEEEQQTITQTQTPGDEALGSDEPAGAEPVAEPTPTIDSPADEVVETAPASAVEPVVQESVAPPQQATSESEPAPEQGEDPAPVAETSAEPLEVADEPSAAAAEPVSASAAAPTPELPSGVKDTRWLLEQDPEYFTLQLVTVSAAESASAFVERQGEPGEFTIYQLQRDGRILHVVLYGLFSSRDAAERAADNLPAEVGQVQPWIRPVGQVQDAARLATRQ
jgi:septal ring-binding cell division protein DamX